MWFYNYIIHVTIAQGDGDKEIAVHPTFDTRCRGFGIVEALIAVTLLAFTVAFVLLTFSSSLDMQKETERTREATRVASQVLEMLRSTPLDYIAPDPSLLPQRNLTLEETTLLQTVDYRIIENIRGRLQKYNLDAAVSIELFDNRIIQDKGVIQTVRLSVQVADQSLFGSGHALGAPEVQDVAVQLSTLMTRGSINP